MKASVFKIDDYRKTGILKSIMPFKGKNAKDKKSKVDTQNNANLIPWNELTIPILMCAMCFGTLTGFVCNMLIGETLINDGIAYTSVGFLAGMLWIPSALFFIWLLSKMTSIFKK